MSNQILEDSILEQPIIELLESLWYTYHNWRKEDFDIRQEYSSLGRRSTKDVLLFDVLKKKIEELNPWLGDSLIISAINELEEIGLNKDLNKANKDLYHKMKEWIKLTMVGEEDDEIDVGTVRLFDFEDYTKNEFTVVSQLNIQGEFYKRRPDLLVYVNGIPLVNIELKGPTVSISDAYNDNLKDYKDTIPKLRWYNAFVILSNGSQTKVGTFSSPRNFFKEWKRQDEKDNGDTSIETTIKGMMTKEYLMDIFENFILHEEKEGKVINIVAQNHQYLWVNKSFDNIQNRKQLDGKLWVFRHTQGSGKSYSMAFLANKVMRKLEGNFTFVVLTDRTELDQQIYDTFTWVGVNTEANEVKADSVKDLRKLLKADHKFVFTLIHKFQDRELDIHPKLSDRDDIIVMVDEAHRSQYDQLALNMRNALPNAHYIAFTGTPLLKGERVTQDIFGKYVSTYNFKKAVDDGATVPIFYENRAPKLKLYNEDFEKDIGDLCDKYDLEDEDAEKFSKEYSKQYKVITRDDVLDTIAKDIVHNYFWQDGYWKAMVVCVDINTTIRMYDKVQEQITVLKSELEQKMVNSHVDFEKREIKNVLDKIKIFDSAVVASLGNTQNETEMKKLGVDRAIHRKIMSGRNLQAEFKLEWWSLKMVFVCNMWLTGLDVKDLRTLYLHKPMQGHTLMQTIARVNRVCTGKENGLIVDYLNLFKNLQKALADYASDSWDKADYPAQDKEQLVWLIQEHLDIIKNFLKKICKITLEELKAWVGFEKLKLLRKISNALSTNDRTKAEWKRTASKVLWLYKSLLPDEKANNFTTDMQLIKAISLYLKVSVATDVDVMWLKKDLEELLNESIKIEEFDFEKKWFFKDLSRVNWDALHKLFDKDYKHIGVQRMKGVMEKQIDEMIKKNPFAIEFKNKLEEIIKKYNSNKTQLEEVFQLLIDLSHDLNEEEKQQVQSWMTEEERIIFMKIYKKGITKKDEDHIKSIAQELYKKVLEVKTKFYDRKHKSQGRALMYTTIKWTLFETVPVPTYSKADAETKTKDVYDYAFEYL